MILLQVLDRHLDFMIVGIGVTAGAAALIALLWRVDNNNDES